MTRITHLDLPSIQRHFVGFDSMFNEMDRMFENSANKGSGYPPYNIAQISEDEFMISVAVAGFSMDNLEITKDQGKNEAKLEELVTKIVSSNKFPIGIGGEHSMTPAAVRAVQSKYPNLAVVILDAHLDFRQEYEGNENSHATVTRRLTNIVGLDKVRPVGIRSVSQSEISEARTIGLKFIESGWTELIEYLTDIIDELDCPIYLSLDMDAIDPAFAPGVGTPEPFGMTPYEVLQTINFFSDRIVAFDCVEVSPPYDNGNTSALAARIIRHLIGAIWQSQERFK